MTPSREDARNSAAAAYEAAADHYDDPTNAYWERAGRRTIERLGLGPGARVLDVCCGSGASAIPAAERVGPSGSVLGVDLAENLLALARAKARSRGLAHAEFRAGDMLELGLPPASFDAVVCVFGIFFVPVMEDAARALWRLVAPGGCLAVTTWGPRLFEPANGAFWDAVGQVRPDLHKAFNPWDRISEPDAVCDLLARAGIEGATATAERGAQPLEQPEEWWSIVLGSGYRGTVEKLTPEAREQVRRASVAFVRERGVTSVETNVVYAVARKPPG
jgi:ubiquinone/menaquinone biosynthesis C-methylase UbiE